MPKIKIETRYLNINVQDLKTAHLKLSNIPNKHLSKLNFEFESEKGKKYAAVYNCNGPIGPHIILCSHNEDKRDLGEIEKIIAEETKGISENLVVHGKEGIYSIVQLRRRPTQQELADSIERSKDHGLKNIKISTAYFEKVPTYLLKNIGFPVNNILFERNTSSKNQ